jgi:hypothetical protein
VALEKKARMPMKEEEEEDREQSWQRGNDFSSFVCC